MFKLSIYQCELTAYSLAAKPENRRGKEKQEEWSQTTKSSDMKANWNSLKFCLTFFPLDYRRSPFFHILSTTFSDVVHFPKSKVSFLSACNVHKPEERIFLSSKQLRGLVLYRIIPPGLFPPFPTVFIQFLNLVSYKSTCNWWHWDF